MGRRKGNDGCLTDTTHSQHTTRAVRWQDRSAAAERGRRSGWESGGPAQGREDEVATSTEEEGDGVEPVDAEGTGRTGQAVVLREEVVWVRWSLASRPLTKSGAEDVWGCSAECGAAQETTMATCGRCRAASCVPPLQYVRLCVARSWCRAVLDEAGERRLAGAGGCGGWAADAEGRERELRERGAKQWEQSQPGPETEILRALSAMQPCPQLPAQPLHCTAPSSHDRLTTPSLSCSSAPMPPAFLTRVRQLMLGNTQPRIFSQCASCLCHITSSSARRHDR